MIRNTSLAALYMFCRSISGTSCLDARMSIAKSKDKGLLMSGLSIGEEKTALHPVEQSAVMVLLIYYLLRSNLSLKLLMNSVSSFTALSRSSKCTISLGECI